MSLFTPQTPDPLTLLASQLSVDPNPSAQLRPQPLPSLASRPAEYEAEMARLLFNRSLDYVVLGLGASRPAHSVV